mmetsp:Transcript_16873/g.37967  ORF Transcript_16873/g.37967 Transcript_16873/m.37967 type:complete len:320 (-) Transcript_16873:63-1022(-)|eukprot:CAMPEP_0113311944 /NCGR_PEP_ID=MMETSP0010_2-20120614/8967_1 /TAXON_ID=216773 ORGANISM="Corethron hystrix, Strain 308" /NCGR_SAMPLE_ID=MMETSP0010_2 /ASSEMBLY_ACC=CAM_ASM_000155 /LENGTH=319 /DNA_ID=CAMNT_0000167661 /DNA_START=100 /DNA_END=1059 /DNA_ORIENTATION=+ /assembly_acc=CAM_ASM_000155
MVLFFLLLIYTIFPAGVICLSTPKEPPRVASSLNTPENLKPTESRPKYFGEQLKGTIIDDPKRRDVLLGGACTCAVCAASSFALGRTDNCNLDKWGREVSPLDERFARIMAGGMRDYEELDEVQGFKKELFSNIQKDDLVLEIGIGSGPNLKYYGSKASMVLAVDPNRVFDNYSLAAATETNTDLKFIPGMAEAIDMPDESVDIVVGTMVLCSVDSVEKSLREVRRILKPGGKYLFTEHIRAPKNWHLLNFAQTIYVPLQLYVAKGCHLRREPSGKIENVFGKQNVHARKFVLSNTGLSPPWPPHFLLSPHLVGYAIKQ